MDLVYFLLLIGPLVFAHELGHFLMAKAFGVKVVKFSLGFGPVMIGKQLGETFYQIAWVPLGGFVKFLGDDPNEQESISEEDRARSWLATARWKRALVIFAGPGFSLLLPILCYFVVGLMRDELLSPTVGQVIPGTPAERAGLAPGDRIASVDGVPVYGFSDLQRLIGTRPEEDLRVEIVRGESTKVVTLRPALVKRMRFRALDITEEVGLIGVHNAYPAPIIGVRDSAAVDGGSPASRAGLRSFDMITAIDGQSTPRWIDVEARLRRASDGERLEVSYLRPRSLDLGFLDLAVLEPGQATLTVDDAVEAGHGTGLDLASLDVAYSVEGYPGHRAGIRVGDEILAIDGQRISIWAELADRLNLEPGEPHEILLRRGAEELTVTLEPERITVEDRYSGQRETFREPGIGVYQVLVLDDPVPNPNRVGRAMRDAVTDTVEIIKFMAVGFARIFQGRVSLQSIGGPLMLWELAGTAGRRGASSFLSVLALISVNLGLLNLLPIPVLDGGNLVILAVEAIRRKSLTLKAREVINIVGLVLLMMLMVYALKNDIQRYWDWEAFVRLFQ